jgi:uncharacterized membrane protein
VRRAGVRRARALCVFLVLILHGCGGNGYPEVKPSGDVIKIPLKDITSSGIRFYTYRHRSGLSFKNINFFVRQDVREQIHAYFDACHTCAKFFKGYGIDGAEIVCNECKKRFKLGQPEWKDDEGCLPIDLKSETRGGYLVIAVADIISGERLFK